MAQSVKNLPTISATQIRSLGGEDPPEKGVSHALQYSCLENPHVPTGCSPSQASHPRGSLAHPTQFQAWLHPTPGCSLQDTAPRAQLAGDLAAAAVPVRAAPPRGSSPPRLFRSRCPPPPPAFPLPLFLSRGPPLRWASAPAAVPVPAPPAPRLFRSRCPPPRGRHAPWARRGGFAAGGGTTRNSRLPRPRRRSPSRASKIVCAILEPPLLLKPEAGLRKHCGSGGGGIGSARGRPVAAAEPPHHPGKPGMTRGTPRIPGLSQPRLDDPVSGAHGLLSRPHLIPPNPISAAERRHQTLFSRPLSPSLD